MSNITVTVNSPSDSVNITVPSSDAPSVSVTDSSSINVSVSPNVAYQNLTNLLDVQGSPTDNQMIVYDEDEGAFVFIDLSSGGGGGGTNIASDLLVTNTDPAFSHIRNYNYEATDNVSLETILRNILQPPILNTLSLNSLSPTTAGTYEVGTTARQVSSIAFSIGGTFQAFDDDGVLFTINEQKTSPFDALIPSTNNNTVYNLTTGGTNTFYNAASSTYSDISFKVRADDSLALSNPVRISNSLTIKIRVRHLFYGDDTEITGDEGGFLVIDLQNLYNDIVASSSALASEQLQDRSDDYIYSNNSDRYNLDSTNNYAYYFYEASLGELTDIKLGGEFGLDIDDAFIHITRNGAVPLSNGQVTTNYHVYRSRNRNAFTSGQSIYFKN